MLAALKQAAGDASRRFAMRLLHEVIPWACVFCGEVGAPDGGAICAACFGDLPWLGAACTCCAMPLGNRPAAGACCGSCLADPPPFERAVVALHYAFPVDAAIKRFKFNGRLHYSPALAEILLSVADDLPTDVDALLPVPLHRWRQMRRGFNQATELARPVARHLGVPLVGNVRRAVATPYQSGLDARQRRRNLASAFAVRGAVGAKHVAIVDDVVTTGATCRQLAAAMLQRDVEKVSVLALARA